MYEISDAQIKALPLNKNDPHGLCEALIRFSEDAKREGWPENWGENTKSRPVVNKRIRNDGLIVGGHLGFYYRHFFYVLKYDRVHNPDLLGDYKLTTADGFMEITGIYIGTSPIYEDNDFTAVMDYNEMAQMRNTSPAAYNWYLLIQRYLNLHVVPSKYPPRSSRDTNLTPHEELNVIEEEIIRLRERAEKLRDTLNVKSRRLDPRLDRRAIRDEQMSQSRQRFQRAKGDRGNDLYHERNRRDKKDRSRI